MRCAAATRTAQPAHALGARRKALEEDSVTCCRSRRRCTAPPRAIELDIDVQVGASSSATAIRPSPGSVSEGNVGCAFTTASTVVSPMWTMAEASAVEMTPIWTDARRARSRPLPSERTPSERKARWNWSGCTLRNAAAPRQRGSSAATGSVEESMCAAAGRSLAFNSPLLYVRHTQPK
eukprot:scaffold205736_cov32-Tisochrysis_lutea.AAC.2